MKSQLDGAGLKFDTFVNYCVDLVWNQMLEEHAKQEAIAKEDAQLAAEVEKEMKDEDANHELDGDSGQVSDAESLDIKESSNG